MLGLADAAACMPAHDEALNDLSSSPPVSVTMQPRVLLPVAAAVVVEPVLGDEVPDEAVPWLLPHAASTSVVATVSAAVAHALRFTSYLQLASRGTSTPDLAYILG